MPNMYGRKLVIEWVESAEELKELYRSEQDAEIKPRLHALWLLRGGQSMQQTAQLVGIHYVTLQQWVAWYRRGGVSEVRRHKHGGRQGQPSKLTAQQIEQLNQQAAQGDFRTAQDVQEWVANTFGVQYRRSGIYGLLARLGWKPKTTRPQAMNAPLVEQEEWKKGG
jgi:transposase